MESKYFRKFALGLIIDKDQNILIQDRENHSKAGESFGFFGGGMEGQEIEIETITREIYEELGVRLNHFQLWKTVEKNIEGFGLGLFHYFIIPLDEIFNGVQSKEGNILRISITDFLKKDDVEPEDREVLEDLLLNWDDIVPKYLRF